MSNILDNVKNGMPVVRESDKEKIGEVEYIKYGEGNTFEIPDTNTLVNLFAEAIGAGTSFPKPIYNKLYAEGFIQVERGLLPDAFVLPDQIVHIKDGEVHINVSESELLTA